MTQDADDDRATGEPTRRALIIAAEYPPIGGGGVMRIAKFVKYLPEFGWDLTVICSDEPDPPLIDPDLLADVEGKARVVRVRGPFRAVGSVAGPVKRAAGGGGRGRAIVRTLKSVVNTVAFPDRWIGWSWKVSRLPLEAYGNPDVVISTGPPHSSHFAAQRIARRLGIPFAMDIRDDWAGNPRFSSRAPFRDRLVSAAERRLMRAAQLVVVMSDTSRLAHVRRHAGLARKIAVIPNGFDPQDFEGRATRVDRPPAREIDFLFAGSIHGFDARPALDLFGRFATAAAADVTPILTLLGAVLPDQAAAAEALVPAANLRIEPSVPHQAAIDRMLAADVLVLLLRRTEVPEMLTGKVFEYLAAGRPILAISGPCAATELIREMKAGASVEPGKGADQAGFREVIEMAGDPGFSGASEASLAAFDRRHLASDLDKRLRAALERPPTAA